MDSIMKAQEEKNNKIEDFIRNKKYMTLINTFAHMNITELKEPNQPGSWTEEVDIMFDFLYSNAHNVGSFMFSQEFNGEIIIEHENTYFSLYEPLFEVNECCLRAIETVDEKPEIYVAFEDIVNYVEHGEIPEKTKALNIINLSLDKLRSNSESLRLDENIEDVREYVIKNLK